MCNDVSFQFDVEHFFIGSFPIFFCKIPGSERKNSSIAGEEYKIRREYFLCKDKRLEHLYRPVEKSKYDVRLAI